PRGGGAHPATPAARAARRWSPQHLVGRKVREPRRHRWYPLAHTMPPHSVGSGTISFGLVSIPVRLYTATSSQNVSFNLLHAKCGSRIRQQTFCPVDNTTVDRSELVRGYEFAKDQYVRVSDDELKAMEGEASQVIDITEFVPLAQVDPIYFERTHYLGPDKGASAKVRENELKLALQLVDGLASEEFEPSRYEDEYRQRVLDLIKKKVEGQEVTTATPAPPRAQVIDLMEALKESLAKRVPS